jgi:hippurate hydrolase
MLQQRPSRLLRIGNGARDDVPLLHTARCDFNDDNLTIGSAYWVRLVERFLER